MALPHKNSLRTIMVALSAAAALLAAPAAAQMRQVDPDAAIDGDLAGEAAAGPSMDFSPGPPADAAGSAGNGMPVEGGVPVDNGASVDSWTPEDLTAAPADPAAGTAASATYRKDDLIGAAEGVFGKGAAGLAGIIEDLLDKQGEPNAYITGREASGAFVFGVRYGSGTLHHKVEGNKPVYWTGPSIGLDAGANAAKAFVLVYNLYDSAELYHRFGAGEGQAYLVGGFHVSYMRRGDVVLIPVRMGAGLRLGINGGYMKFSENQRWLPF